MISFVNVELGDCAFKVGVCWGIRLTFFFYDKYLSFDLFSCYTLRRFMGLAHVLAREDLHCSTLHGIQTLELVYLVAGILL